MLTLCQCITHSLRVEQKTTIQSMTAVGFEPTQIALVELESTPLDHSGKLSIKPECDTTRFNSCQSDATTLP